MTGKQRITSDRINSLLGEELIVHSKMGEVDKGKVLYGETYDMLGVTIDSLKYYLFLEYLARLSENRLKPMVVEADLHSVINKSIRDKEQVMREGVRRVKYLQMVFRRLRLEQLEVKLMSELFEEMGKKLSRVRERVAGSRELQGKLAKTVLQNRVRQEEEVGYRYAAEAIALASEFEVKVGPPREEFYDQVARQLLPELGYQSYDSIYLRPSYPLTDVFSYYLTHPEIERYGVTPYKAGSNKLQDLRIVLGVTPISRVRELMEKVLVPNRMEAANPPLDLAVTVIMLKQLKKKELNPEGLKSEIEVLVEDRQGLVGNVVDLLERLYE